MERVIRIWLRGVREYFDKKGCSQNIIELIGKYEESLINLWMKRSCEIKEYLSHIPDDHEVYTRYMDFGQFQIPLIWNIELLKKELPDLGIPVQKVDLDSIVQHIPTEEINQDKLKIVASINNPIIIAEFEPFKTNFAIDGNHRAYEKKYLSNETEISAYVLPSEVHKKYFMHPFYTRFYHALINVNRIDRYLNRKKNKKLLKDILIPLEKM